MKKILSLVFASLILFSCSDEEVLNDGSNLEKGGFASFESVIQTVDYQGGNGVISYVAQDVNNNAAIYRIYKMSAIVQGNDLGEVTTNFEYNSFPANVSISLADIAALYGITSSDITYGDSFQFYAEVVTTDGRTFRGESPAANNLDYTPNNTTEDLLNSAYGYRQAMNFRIVVACQSYVQADMLGTYTATNDSWDYPLVNGHTFECVLGDNPNELKFVAFRNDSDVSAAVPARSYDLVVRIDPASQSVVIDKQENWNSAMYGLTYGIASVEGTGLVFSCIGQISMNLKHTVAAGSFGTYNLTFTKVP